MNPMQENRIKNKFNYQMCILSAIGMIAVMLGHIDGGYINESPQGIITLGGWLPYYSYHMPLFIFISGYFYNKDFENHISCFLRKKFRTMILSFYAINGAFFLFQSLIRLKGFTVGYPFSLKVWLIYPWITRQPIDFSIPTWYLIAIFLAELFFILLRKIVSFFYNNKQYELLLLFTTLVLGVASVICVRKLNPPEWAIVYLRSLIMVFFLEAGYFYRNYLEENVQKINNAKYFGTLFAMQGVMIALLHGDLDSGLWGITNGFRFYGFAFYIEGIIGITFWLRISEFIAQIPQKFKSLIFIGKNSKWIMSFHLFGYFVMNTLIYLALKISGKISQNALFDVGRYKTQIYYCIPKKQLAILYILFGLVITFVLMKIGYFIKKWWKNFLIQAKIS